MKHIIASIIGSCCFLLASAQTLLPLPANLKAAYDKGTRSTNGMPGKNYWQNSADYHIDISFDPQTRLLSGSEEIIYVNSSPDTLKDILFKLYPNLYKKGSPRAMKIDDADAGDGLIIEELKVNNALQPASARRIDATNMNVRIPALAPKQTIKFNIKFSYTLNKGSHIRTGQVDEGAFFIAYFFPRIAVYDDAEGWNRNPYLGSQEFYNDFCNFTFSVSVPDNYAVWATGDLKNSSEVFNPAILQRLQQAETNDGFVDVIDSNNIAAKNITTNNKKSWLFKATNVPDIAIAVSDHYLWQSSSLVVDKATGRRTRVDAVFNKVHRDYFHVLSDARKTVGAMSFNFPKWPYPYSHETVFDGLDQMEYPMMVNDNPVEDRAESIELTDHEIFHTMFPFYMGINETKYGWMDEGWATIGEWLISPMIDSSIVDEYGMSATEKMAGTEVDLPIVTLTTQITGTTAFINNYPKPALGYLYAKDMLGDELFYKGLHNYFRNWNSKHPLPNDFFYSMNAGSGKNLNWFWKRWFFDNGIPDLAITKLSGTGKQKQLFIEAKGSKPVPVDISITYADGSVEKIHRSMAVWEKSDKLVVTFNAAKSIKSISLGSTYVPDANKADNIYIVK
ncbi:MAG: peptidase [Ferruginibacter sp.]|nr:peptidase [Ferruginibacter sp.]